MPTIIEITDLSAPELAVYTRLTEAQLRNKLEPEKGIFIAESLKVIGTALDAGCVPLSFLMERPHIEGSAAAVLARCPDTPRVHRPPRDPANADWLRPDPGGAVRHAPPETAYRRGIVPDRPPRGCAGRHR